MDGTVESCTCSECVAMCQTPCWGTPAEIKAIGYEKMMLNYWFTMDEHIEIVTPANNGKAGQQADWWAHGRCMFLNDQDRCMLHDPGLKPVEGRLAFHEGEDINLRRSLKDQWNSEEGRAIVKEWRAYHGLEY